jgi:hypothetical protein
MKGATLILATGALALFGCRSAPPADDHAITLDDWAAFLARHTACIDLPSPDSTWRHVSVTELSLTLLLPGGFVEHGRRDTSYRSWKGADSSKVELWITDSPASGFATTGQVGVDSVSECAFRNRDSGWLVTRFRLTATAPGAITYLGMVHAMPAPGRAVNAYLASPSAAERDRLIAAILATRLDGHR